MAESCSSFVPHLWKPNVCRDCTKTKEDHSNCSSTDVPLSLSHEVNNDDGQDSSSSAKDSSNTRHPPCRYGSDCYRTNPSHLERYSHPHVQRQCTSDRPLPEQTTASSSDSSPAGGRRRRISSRKKEELQFIDQVETHIRSLTTDLNSKDEEIEQLRQDQLAMKTCNENLERIVIDETERRERREIEEKRLLSIPQQTPSYWGPNAFSESRREIQLSNESPEFRLIKDLLNSTITTHGNLFGTIYGQDPTEFVVTEIKRVQNRRLWHEYCCKKDTIINKNHHRLSKSGGSLHLQAHPLLTPLLDSQSNEYWLFHGCSHETLHHLLNAGYDPRVSNLKGMFGGGFYLAENSSKSNQYIPCPECKQNAIPLGAGCTCPNQEDFVFAMLLYRVILGDVHVAEQYDKTKYCKQTGKTQYVRRPPMKTGCDEIYDSVMGESIAHGGDRLQNREFVLYERGQAYPEYLIGFRRSAQNAHSPADTKRVLERCRNFLINTFRSLPE